MYIDNIPATHYIHNIARGVLLYAERDEEFANVLAAMIPDDWVPVEPEGSSSILSGSAFGGELDAELFRPPNADAALVRRNWILIAAMKGNPRLKKFLGQWKKERPQPPWGSKSLIPINWRAAFGHLPYLLGRNAFDWLIVGYPPYLMGMNVFDWLIVGGSPAYPYPMDMEDCYKVTLDVVIRADVVGRVRGDFVQSMVRSVIDEFIQELRRNDHSPEVEYWLHGEREIRKFKALDSLTIAEIKGRLDASSVPNATRADWLVDGSRELKMLAMPPAVLGSFSAVTSDLEFVP